MNAGDILSLVEKAESNIKGADAERMAKRMMEAKFDFNDFMEQSRMMSQMGSMGAMMKMIPGAPRACALVNIISLVTCPECSAAGGPIALQETLYTPGLTSARQ